MSIEQVRRFVLFVVLLLVQGLVLNHIHLFDCATPLIYIILVLHFRRNQSRWSALLWSFPSDSVLMFCQYPRCGSCFYDAHGTGSALSLRTFHTERQCWRSGTNHPQHWCFFLFLVCFIMILLYCLVFFTLETFNFFNWIQWLKCIGGSTLLTYLLVMALESIKK